MNNEHLEELAALHALHLLDESGERELTAATGRDAEVDALLRDFDETAALFAYEAPARSVPAHLKAEILRNLPQRTTTAVRTSPFPHWVAYAIAACLMALGITQAIKIRALESANRNLQSGLFADSAEMEKLRASNDLDSLRMAMVPPADAAKSDPGLMGSKIMVAWDPMQHRGVVATENLPAAPAGHDYQLWVLDPKAEKPISAGTIDGSRCFAVTPVNSSNPGFAISMEPAGGMPTPTGPILFAVAPGQ
jgi:anti-sigma-K factor RskA